MSDVKSKKNGTKKSKSVSVETPVVEASSLLVEHPPLVVSVTPEPEVQTVTLEQSVEVTTEAPTDVSSEEPNTDLLFNKLINQVQDFQLVMKTLHLNLKVLQKEVLRERKESKKKELKGKKKSDKKRLPSGFAKPSAISNSLATFFNLPGGSELARTEVTSKINSYIKENNLQNPDNKKQILLDDKLQKLLNLTETDNVTYFNLQTYLKQHFLAPVTEDATVV